jgi:small neutral amino acid transporter SnatA (MarC family)
MLISKNAATQLGGVLYAIGASVLCFAVVFVVLNWSHVLFRLIGKIGTLAVGRVMDIFIVAIGVHFIFTSLRQAFGLKLGM